MRLALPLFVFIAPACLLLAFTPLSATRGHAASPARNASEPSRAVPFQFLHKGQPAPDFSLIDQEGRPLRLSDFRGQPVILTFFHTSCQDYCPLILKGRSRLEASARDDVGEDPVFLAVTMDPKTDTPEVLRAYIENLGLSTERLHLLTGPPEDVHRVLDAYHVQTIRNPETGIVATHTMVAYAIDREGVIRKILVFNFSTS